MGHGFGATKDAGLEPFAERFAAAGLDVLVFDYRGYGTSDGQPRQDVNHLRHREDYHAAVARARALPGVDPERIVVWGSSYSGGHVIAVAAQDPRIAGVVSQGAAMDGLAAVLLILRYAGPMQLLRLTGHALLDLAGSALRRGPHLIPVVGPPGSLAAITSEGAEAGYRHIMGPTFRNEMCARGILRIPLNRPVRLASRVQAPTMLVLATGDNVAPPDALRTVAERLRGRVEVLTLDVGHFDIYVGDPFGTSVAAQVEFLTSLSPVHRAR
jgi:pimeloyl-ACP methyl ester carboxylesterase